MTFQEINALIEKYFAGETSLEDEKLLRGYFNGSDVDARLASYAPLFQFFEKEKTVVFSADKLPKFEERQVQAIQNQPFSFKILNGSEIPILSGLRGGYFWKIAATLAFLVVSSVAIFKVFEPKATPIAQHRGAKMIILDGDDDPEEALAKVNEALALVSKKMKKGTDETTDGLLKLKNATTILNNEN